ncbi:MAG: hypothetical protein ABUL60_19175 [Myxococcales bacterium]
MADGVRGLRGVAAALTALCALACGATSRNEATSGGGGGGGGGVAKDETLPATGRAGSAGGGGSPNMLEAPIEVSGRWAQFGTDDAVAAELVQTNGMLTGNGCVLGLPTSADSADHYCGPIKGQLQGARVSFGYSASVASEGADLWLSSDGQRMAGRHLFDGAWFAPVSWLRIGAADSHLPHPPEHEAAARALSSRTGRWSLTQLEGPAPLFLGSAELGVELHIQSDAAGGFVLGTLGAFWHGEMSWSEPDGTLQVGPVPETVPGLPLRLELRFVDSALQSVDATLPTGELQRFSATPSR